MSRATSASLIEDLIDAVGVTHVLTEPDVIEPYRQDWSRRYAGPVLAVARPADLEQTVAVVAACTAHHVPVLAQGGNTGLVGGSVPGPSDPPMVVLSTRRLTRLDDVDLLTGQVTAGAGVTIADLHRHVNGAGWAYGVDLASRDSATVGGTIATNAGGIRVCCYGMTRRQVLGLEAVLPNGSVVSHLGGLLKDNTGYDLTGLLTGSEGTLGVITAARLALVRKPRASAVALVGVQSAAHALAVIRESVPDGTMLLGAEIMDEATLSLVSHMTGLPWPLSSHPAHVMTIETESTEPGEIAMRFDDDLDVVVATDPTDRARLWSYRERAGESIGTQGIAHRFDVSVPRSDWDGFVDDVRDRLRAVPDVAALYTFGHLADGNLHVEVMGPHAGDERADETVLQCVADHQGSISAEHGVGRAKSQYLHLTRSAQEIAAMRAVKAAFDPENLFNPGAIFT
ncbi:MAG: FAD-binding oxidoreductase [Actinomycetes bacterium]